MLHMKRRTLLQSITAGLMTLASRVSAEARGTEAAVLPQASVEQDTVATLALLDRFAAAWNAHDIDTLMACMTDDGVFESAAGATVAGTRSVGTAAVRRAYQAVFDTYPDARWNEPRHFVAGTRAVTEWRFTGTTRDGQKVEVNGCDVFTLRNGRIALKNSYRKQRS